MLADGQDQRVQLDLELGALHVEGDLATGSVALGAVFGAHADQAGHVSVDHAQRHRAGVLDDLHALLADGVDLLAVGGWQRNLRTDDLSELARVPRQLGIDLQPVESCNRVLGLAIAIDFVLLQHHDDVAGPFGERGDVQIDLAIAADAGRLETALTGGDDYEIVCTVSPAKLAAFGAAAKAANVAVTEIGEITAGEGARFTGPGGEVLAFKKASFSHF